MDKFLYQCRYCGREYKPNRRYKQIFCSSSCRANSHLRNKKLKIQTPSNITNEEKKTTQIDKISMAGVGNAIAGTAIVKIAEAIFTSDDHKPATKKDIREIINTLKQRYFSVKNMPSQQNGTYPFFDILSNIVVYLKK